MIRFKFVALAFVIATAGGLVGCKRSAIDEAGNTLRRDVSKPPPPYPAYPPPRAPTPDQRSAAVLGDTGHVTLTPGGPKPLPTRR